MDKVKKHRKIVHDILDEIVRSRVHSRPEIHSYLVEDEKKGHFLLFSDGWVDNDKRFYGCSVHVQVDDRGMVWLFYDMSDYEIGKQILEKGIPPNQLVPAFQPPDVREEMGFAVA